MSVNQRHSAISRELKAYQHKMLESAGVAGIKTQTFDCYKLSMREL